MSYGTLGPSLLAYGKNRQFGEPDTKAAYDKIMIRTQRFPLQHAAFRDQQDPHHRTDQGPRGIRLMSPDSPVNK